MATTFAPSDLSTKPVRAGQGEAIIYDGKVTGTPSTTTDILRFCRIPAGTRLCDVNARIATAFAAAWGGNWQLRACDGASDAITSASGTTAVLQAVGAVTAGLYPLNFEPVTTKVDCFLELQLSALTTGAAGVATATAYGVAQGAA